MWQLPKQPFVDELLVGNETSDDAGVYKINDELALIQTLDFFTPIVDDPYMFGQIAAANSLSDVYAMGGDPKTVMNIVGYPIKKLGPDVLAEILKGASDKVVEANAVTIGGHSIDDQEPKFGLSVTGFVHPDKYWKNVGAKPGDVLILTKPIGVGILTTGIKRSAVTPEQEQTVIKTMATLNKVASLVVRNYTPSAVTDITGFGLLGHGKEMAQGSNVTFEIQASSVPMLEGTLELANKGIVPGGSKANHKWIANEVSYNGIDESMELILCDAITSGGLLISINESDGQKVLEDLHQAGITESKIIGKVVEQKEKAIYVYA